MRLVGECDGEDIEKKEVASQYHHQPEGGEGQSHRRYCLVDAVEVSVAEIGIIGAEVLERCLHCGFVARFSGCIVCGESLVGGLAALDALGVGDGVDGVSVHDVHSLHDVGDARHEGVGVMFREDGESVGDGDVEQILILVVVPPLVGVEDGNCGYCLGLVTVIETFHRGEFHRLMACNLHRRAVTCPYSENQSDKPEP